MKSFAGGIAAVIRANHAVGAPTSARNSCWRVNGAMEIWISYRGIKGLAQRRHVGEGGSDRQAYRSIDGRAGAATLQGDACVLQHDRSAPRRPLHSTCLPEFQTAAPPFIAKQSISGHKGRMDCFRLRSLSYGGRIVACAPRNDTERVWTRLGIIAARSTRAFPIVCPKKRAQETPGALGTRSPCAMVVSTR